MAVCLFAILIICVLPKSWAEMKENNRMFDMIEHSIGIAQGFNPQKLFQKFGTKYYYIPTNEKMTWYSAVHRCHRLGGELISLTDNVTLAEVCKAINHNKYTDFWIDLSDLGNESEFVSMSSGQTPRFVNWCENETSSTTGAGNCVNIVNNKNTKNNNNTKSRPCMKSISCIDFKSYICESRIPRTVSIVLGQDHYS